MVWRAKRPENPNIGDAWFYDRNDPASDEVDYWLHDVGASHLSNAYKASGRSPIVICLPSKYTGKLDFCVDTEQLSDGNWHEPGWAITIASGFVDGQQLVITLAPSVNIVGEYHGFIQNGVVGDG